MFAGFNGITQRQLPRPSSSDNSDYFVSVLAILWKDSRGSATMSAGLYVSVCTGVSGDKRSRNIQTKDFLLLFYFIFLNNA